MKWGEIDGVNWTLPAARNKTKVDLIRPFSRRRREIYCPELPTHRGLRVRVHARTARSPIRRLQSFKTEF